MTGEQRKRLVEYLDDKNVDIRTIEYPSGLSLKGKTHFDSIKIYYHMTIPERDEKRGYIDWYGTDGWSIATEYKGVIE
jgi:hypothetical protein